ncbi:unnamed protein product [marine sediment metagenome]|uniref:Uncharacterized protein n=1 Tax=marine sediment metagenome TaxID=412755 RepID=X1RNC0_9ZZZZ
MPPTRPPSDITIRGGIINVPASISPSHPPRHQPDTPRTKKRTTTKPDHQPVTATAAAPPVPPPDEPENPPIIADDLTETNPED